MKKTLSLCLISLLLFGMLSACGNGSAPADGTSGPNSSADDTPGPNSSAPATPGDSVSGEDTAPADISGDLLFWSDNEDFANAIIEAFTAKYPNVTMRWEEAALDTYSRISLDGPSGTGPDVFHIGQDQVGVLIDDGILEPFPAGLQAKVEDAVLESALVTVSSGGRLYGVPYSVQSVCLFYNKDLVDGPPATMEELIEFAHSYNEPAAGKYAMRWTLDGYHNYGFLSAFGYRIFGGNMDWKNPGLDTPEMARGLEYYASLRSIFDYAWDDANWNATVVPFQMGEVPFIITGPWLIQGAIENGLNFGAAILPTVNGVKPLAFSNNTIIGVSSYSRNFDAAFAFAEFAASEEFAFLTYSVYNATPTLKDISGVEGLSDDEVFLGMAAQAPYTEPAPNIPEIQAFWAALGDMCTFVWDGHMTVEDAQKKAMETYETALNVGGKSMYD